MFVDVETLLLLKLFVAVCIFIITICYIGIHNFTCIENAVSPRPVTCILYIITQVKIHFNTKVYYTMHRFYHGRNITFKQITTNVVDIKITSPLLIKLLCVLLIQVSTLLRFSYTTDDVFENTSYDLVVPYIFQSEKVDRVKIYRAFYLKET